MFAVISIEYSNGFPYFNGEAFARLNEALSFYRERCEKAKEEFPDSVAVESLSGDDFYLETFSIEDDRPTGCAHFYGIISEESMMDSIKTYVDNARGRKKFVHYGQVDYEMLCNYVELACWGVPESTDFDKNGEWEITGIIRRPYDTDCPNDPDNAYDVSFQVNDFEYVESLERIGIYNLIEIFGSLLAK